MNRDRKIGAMKDFLATDPNYTSHECLQLENTFSIALTDENLRYIGTLISTSTHM